VLFGVQQMPVAKMSNQAPGTFMYRGFDGILYSTAEVAGLQTTTATYSTTNGAALLSATSFGYPGDYVMVQLDTSIVLRSVRFYVRDGYGYRGPGLFRIYGTNNNASEYASPTWSLAQWTLVHDNAELRTYKLNNATNEGNQKIPALVVPF